VAATVVAAASSGRATPTRQPASRPVASVGCASTVAPYYYLSWGSPQNAVQVMQSTGVSCFTVGFVLSNSSYQPMWDGNRALSPSNEATTIANIRAAGGDVIVSSGGSTTSLTLEVKAPSSTSLASAYSKTIDAFQLKAFDVDLEGSALSNYTVQSKVLAALKTVKASHPNTKLILTIPSGQTGLHSDAMHLLTTAVANRTPIDIWSIMPFDFGNSSTNMATATTSASEALHTKLKSSYPGLTDAQLYKMQGISTMNGITDTNEIVSESVAASIQKYAVSKGLGRLTFWALNRDRQCTSGLTVGSSCSGVTQQALDFTKIFLTGHV
jgi:hypothetical protein